MSTASNILLICISLLSMQCKSQTECWDYVECAGETFTGDDERECFGHKSCYQTDFDTTGDIICSGMESCAGEGGGFAIQSSNDITCSGHKACYGEKDGIPITSTDGDIKCGAQMSCRAADLSAKNMDCSGEFSCSASYSNYWMWGVHKIHVQNDIQCSSERSCYWQYITANSVTCSSQEACYGAKFTASSVTCSAELSCEKSDVNGYDGTSVIASGKESMVESKITATTVIGTGYESLKKAKISPPQTNSAILNVELLGYNTGMNAKINCPDGAKCTLTCSGNACEGTTISCARSANCKVYPVGCGIYGQDLNEDAKGRKPKPSKAPKPSKQPKPTKGPKPSKSPKTKKPKPTKSPKTKKPKPTKPVTTVPPPNNPQPMDPVTGIICPHYIGWNIEDDESEIDNDEIDSVTDEIDNDEIKPDSTNECLNAFSCTGQSNPGEDNYGRIQIFGYKACAGCSLAAVEHIECMGDSSCQSATSITGPVVYDDLYCKGPFSCANIGIIDAETVLECAATSACANVGLIKTRNVECGAKQSCAGSNIQLKPGWACAGCTGWSPSVNCVGALSCRNSIINAGQFGAKLSCSGESSCSEGEYNAHGEIECKSYKSCEKSNIKNSQLLLLNGELAGTGSIFTDIEIIYAYGKRALENANIIALNKGFSAYLYGYQSGFGATITCSTGLACDLNCKFNGCENTKYICQSGASCFLTPNDCKNNNNNIASD
eukprot:527716_1